VILELPAAFRSLSDMLLVLFFGWFCAYKLQTIPICVWQGPNLLKLARKEQCLALLTDLRKKYKTDGQFYRVFPNGEVCPAIHAKNAKLSFSIIHRPEVVLTNICNVYPIVFLTRVALLQVQYLHPKDGVYPEKGNQGRTAVNTNQGRIGENGQPVQVGSGSLLQIVLTPADFSIA
jgi:hypothetical protein